MSNGLEIKPVLFKGELGEDRAPCGCNIPQSLPVAQA